MKQLSLIVLLAHLSFSVCWGQTYSIKGSVEDTMNVTKLPQACVTLIYASDSILAGFTRSNEKGGFELKVDSPGKYIMMISYPSFADHVESIKVQNKDVDMGAIPMISRTHLMKEFVLTQQIAAIKIKGDTTEYVADSFKVKDNATVEDLLKKLPGIQVDKDGKVVAQGETVQKILVDGEEFFSDDPAVVTKGLQAAVVDKVQVFDKKSDQATFTGIDDGEKTKTINLQLKENKKKGYFGKIVAGGGTDGYFQNQGMINAFKGKRQLSAFGIVSNTDKVGLGWADKDKYSTGNGTTTTTDDGSIVTYYSGTNDDFNGWNGKYNGQGLPKVWTGGVHFADKSDDDKQHVSGNYRYAMQNVEISGNTITQTPITNSNQHRDQFSTGQKQGTDFLYEWKIDSTSSLKLTLDAGVKETKTSSSYNTVVMDSLSKDTLNTNKRSVTADVTAKNIDADLLYRKKFAKKGRSLSIDFKEAYNDSKSTGFLNSTTYLDSAKTYQYTNQRKENDNYTQSISSKITYTEPLSKIAFLELNYGLTVNNSTSSNFSYDKPLGGPEYDQLNDTFSSNYAFNILTNSGGANFRFVMKKMNFSFGGNISNAQFKQIDHMYHDSTYNRNYLNFYPRASFTYKIKKQTSFSINYYGSTEQPKIDQIQPLRQNLDPLNVAIGNPNLKQGFDHQIWAQFNDYKVLSGRSIWSSFSMNILQDAITTKDFYNAGVRTYQYVNVNGNYSMNGYFGYWWEWKKLETHFGANIEPQFSHMNSFLNGSPVTSNNNSYTFSFNAEHEKEKKYSISIDPSLTYNDNRSSVSNYTYSYFIGNTEFKFSIDLPKRFEIGSSLNWFLRQTTPIFTQNNNVMLWNAYIAKKFLKNDELEIRLTANDLLNQNIGFSRSAQSGIITQNDYNTIRRYAMINLVWNFTKTPAAVADDNTKNKKVCSMKKIEILLFILLLPCLLRAQFTSQGKIEYERKVAVHALMDSDPDNEWYQRIKSQVPKFSTNFYDLYFTATKTLYKPGKESENQSRMMGAGTASENIVLTDMVQKKVKACKTVYEQKFIVEDSIRNLKWKITDEIRTIANYKCRKAVSKICDSVYVVAFYTEDITVSGGPEMMGGLPGMILELAIPRLHTTWTATRVEITAPKESDFTVPDKGKHVNQKELFTTIKDSFKDWGKSGQSYMWWIFI